MGGRKTGSSRTQRSVFLLQLEGSMLPQTGVKPRNTCVCVLCAAGLLNVTDLLFPLYTQGHQIKCDVHSAATHIRAGFSLYADVHGARHRANTAVSPSDGVTCRHTSLLPRHTPNHGQFFLPGSFQCVPVVFCCLSDSSLIVLHFPPCCSAPHCHMK